MLRRSLPLALTMAVHLLIAALFLARRPPPPNTPVPPSSYMIAVLRPTPPPAATPTAAAMPLRPRAAPRATLSVAPPAPQVAAVPVAPAVDELAPAPAIGSLVERARRDVGKIDRELRGGKSVAVGLAADSPRARFATLMASAFIDRSNTMTIDLYQSGDGVVITRVTRRGGSTCYVNGTVNFRPGILSDSSKPKTVNCPKGDGWTRQ